MKQINLIPNGTEQTRVKEYLEQNASDILAEKINNGTPYEKDGKQLLNKKTLDGFMKYASGEARKLAAKGANSACIDDPIVFGWAIHYFEENSIEGTLYNPDGTEYKPTPKVTSKPTTSPVKKPEPKKEQQWSFFDMLNDKSKPSDAAETEETTSDEEEPDDDIIDDEEQNNELVNQPTEIIAAEEEKPKGNDIFHNYMSVQERYPDSVIAYRFGDFYEIFGQNAVDVARELDLTLTGRDLGLETRVPMIGFPYHAADNYVNKLISKGYKVAMVENIGNVTLKQKDYNVDTETGEILDYDNDEQDEKELMKNYQKEALLPLLEIFGDDANIG